MDSRALRATSSTSPTASPSPSTESKSIRVRRPTSAKRIAAQRGEASSRLQSSMHSTAAERECFWLDATSLLSPPRSETVAMDSIELGPDEILAATNLFRQIIDFPVRFTTRHSAGAAAEAESSAALFSAFPPANSG